jgi:hypothetical protein
MLTYKVFVCRNLPWGKGEVQGTSRRLNGSFPVGKAAIRSLVQAARLVGWNAPALFRNPPPENANAPINFFRPLALFPVCVISSARAA